HAGMTAPARRGNAVAEHAARLVSARLDVVFAVAVAAGGRADEAGLLLRPGVDAVVVLARDVVVAARARRLRELRRVRQLDVLREIGVAVDAPERTVDRVLEPLRVDRDRAAVVALRV